MTWFLLSLVTAVCSALEPALAKRWYGELSPWEMMGVQMLWSLPLCLALLLLTPMPTLQPGFWTQLLLLLPGNMLASIWVFKAVKRSPLSLTLPFMSVTPLVSMLPGYLMLGETPHLAGLLGVALLAAGSYLLHLDLAKAGGWLAPIKAIGQDAGVRFMLGAAIVFGLVAVQGKDLVLKSDLVWSQALFFTIQNALIVLGLAWRAPGSWRRMGARAGQGLLVAGLWGVHIWAHYSAIVLVDTAYMLAVKRLSGIFAVLFGGAILKEDNLRQRLLGTLCMSLGAAVLALMA